MYPNRTWGAARVASELSLKFAVRVSPRTAWAYWPRVFNPQRRSSSQHWMTLVRTYTRSLAACDFVVALTFRVQLIYVFIVMEVGSRKILHVNVAPYPAASWTLQQLREAIPSDHEYRWLIHDRSDIFSEKLYRDVNAFGIAVVKTPVRAPKADAHNERMIGSLCREWLDWFIPMSERHARTPTREWAIHHNQGRPHKSLGQGTPDRPTGSKT